MGPRLFHGCLALLIVFLLCRDAAASGTWCVAKPDASDEDLQKGINYACGPEGQANCKAIQQGRRCFEPNTLHDHASYAYNSYYQNLEVPTKWKGPTCDFDGTAMVTSTDPSTETCKYPCPLTCNGETGDKA